MIWRALCLIQFFLVLVIFAYLGLTPAPEQSVPMFNDKLMHCTGYFFGGLSISFAFPRWKFMTRAMVLVSYSIGIEIAQHFMPPRTFDPFDMIANTIGVLFGLAVIAMLSAKSERFTQFLFWKTE